MNKKANLIIVIVLLALSLYFYFTYVLDRTASETPQPSPSAEISGNISVELSLKTPESTSSAMAIDLPAGADQCEVLKKAQAERKISNLDMRYNEEFKTNGVYVINGIGKTDSPWWVYKINGSDAPAGCSQIKVNQGDKIQWEYLGE